jgi:hypothetical protein
MKDDALAIGRPRRSSDVAARSALATYVVDAAARIRLVLSHIADLISGKRRGIDFHSRAGGQIGGRSRVDVDRNQFRVITGRDVCRTSPKRLFRRHAVSHDVSAIRHPFRTSAEAAAFGNLFEP